MKLTEKYGEVFKLLKNEHGKNPKNSYNKDIADDVLEFCRSFIVPKIEEQIISYIRTNSNSFYKDCFSLQIFVNSKGEVIYDNNYSEPVYVFSIKKQETLYEYLKHYAYEDYGISVAIEDFEGMPFFSFSVKF